jgi:hypothetical protein
MESSETLLNNHWLGKRGSLSFLVGTISNVLVMDIGWTDVFRVKPDAVLKSQYS